MSDRPVSEENVERLRAGHGANCSSIGSVIDTLFASAAVGAAVFAAVVAALRTEGIRVTPRTSRTAPAPPAEAPPASPEST